MSHKILIKKQFKSCRKKNIRHFISISCLYLVNYPVKSQICRLKLVCYLIVIFCILVIYPFFYSFQKRYSYRARQNSFYQNISCRIFFTFSKGNVHSTVFFQKCSQSFFKQFRIYFFWLQCHIYSYCFSHSIKQLLILKLFKSICHQKVHCFRIFFHQLAKCIS